MIDVHGPTECPACEGHRVLRALDPHLPLPVPLRRCDRCRGIWADSRSVQAAAEHYHQSHYVMVEGHGGQACRNCGALLRQGLTHCGECQHAQALDCPSCDKPMTLMKVQGVTLDVCRECKAVWFDAGELGLIARRHSAALTVAVAPAASRDASPPTEAIDGTSLALHGADAAAQVAIEGVAASVDVAGAASNVIAASGDVVLQSGASSAELAGEASGVVLDVVGDILAGIFSGF